MNRRTALKRFAITGAAAMLLPACVRDSKKVPLALENLKITVEDEELLGQIAETLIPATDKPGAREVGAHLFAFVMVDDCSSPDKKEMFMNGLRSFNKNAPVPEKKMFTDASAEEKLQTLKNIEEEKEGPDESISEFYSMARRYIIQGYTTSQYFLTDVKPHKLVPGPVYKGCVPLPQNLQS
jgi:hypothetical protein